MATMPPAPTPGPIGIETLTAPGKASLTEKNGQVRITGNNAVAALQLLAKEGKIAILLTPEEAARLTASGKLKISVGFTRGDGPSVVKAAQTISELAAAAHLRTGNACHRGWGRRLSIALLFVAVVAAAFLLAIAALDAAYGTDRLSRLTTLFRP